MRSILPACLAALVLAGAAPQTREAAAPPLVVEKDGNWTIDQFEACGPGDGSTTLQVLTHAEASSAAVDRERFAAAVSRASWVEIARLARSSELQCREVAAPVGDVDYEIDVRRNDAGFEVASVDVTARNVTQETGYRMRQVRRDNPRAEPAAGPCASTAMGQTFCAHSPQGVAVVTTMGEVVCARGDCAREQSGQWHCARQAGGEAFITPAGPACDGGCYAPTNRQCRAV